RVKEVAREWDTLAEALRTPIVYHPGGWEDTVPGWLKEKVWQQRVAMIQNGGWSEATDAEVVCYLMTASLIAPFDGDWTNIYTYEVALFMPQVRESLPDTPKVLSDYLQMQLRDLKHKIRGSQLKRRSKGRRGGNMAKRKLVLEESDGSVIMGIMQPDADPVVETVAGSMEEALASVPALLTRAEEKWAESPRNPKYVAPKTPAKAKTTPATVGHNRATPAAATPAAGDLPLLANTPAAAPEPAAATEPAPEAATEAATGNEPATEPATEPAAEAATEAATGNEPAAEPATEPAAEATAAEAATEEAAPATEPATEPVPGVAAEGDAMATSEDVAAAGKAAAPPPAATRAAAPVKGEWEYMLKDGRGPFADIQAAMNELAMDAENRPHHNRWDRLSTQLKEQIPRRPKES
ncbi:hypothetical protein LCGC14_1457090, partial [marine sediment metagenome]